VGNLQFVLHYKYELFVWGPSGIAFENL